MVGDVLADQHEAARRSGAAGRDIIVAHYDAVRAEILQRQRKREQYVMLYGTGISVIAGVVAGDPTRWGLLGAVPFLAASVAALYANNDIAIAALGRWLRGSYEALLREYEERHGLGYALAQWDASTELDEFHHTGRALRYFSMAVIFALPGAAAALATLELADGGLSPRWLFHGYVGSLAVLTATAAYLPIHALRARRGWRGSRPVRVRGPRPPGT